ARANGTVVTSATDDAVIATRNDAIRYAYENVVARPGPRPEAKRYAITYSPCSATGSAAPSHNSSRRPPKRGSGRPTACRASSGTNGIPSERRPFSASPQPNDTTP